MKATGENISFVVESDTLETVITAALTQSGQTAIYLSRALQNLEKFHAALSHYNKERDLHSL